MNRDEQVEDMVIIAEEWDDECLSTTIATALYEAGYRKASEVALEVIEDLEDRGLLNVEPWAVAEVKKEYKEKYDGRED